jgi:hypothetical protein
MAQKELEKFLKSKNLLNVEIVLSDEEPKPNMISGKYKHVYKDFEIKTNCN